MHRLVSGRSLAVLMAPILLSMLVFYRLKKKKGKSAEKECTEGPSSAPSLISPMPTATGVGNYQYDVFLSFRGPDTRRTFADLLYHSLINAGISVFMDTESIPVGEQFVPHILRAITRSKISIPIISENYASSSMCLRELIHMMHCMRSMPHLVLPLFYHVDPSDVRHLRGNFGQAFNWRKRHLQEEFIQEGEQALREVACLNGPIAEGRDAELVERITGTILSRLGLDSQLPVTKKKKSAEKECTEGPSSAPSLISPIPTATGGGNDQHDVFLSFRGLDTRRTFADLLYHSLINAGISVFMDNESIAVGEEFDSEIRGAITRSKISIPIISENYASSKMCLRELIHIIKCMKSNSHIMLPIFYKVDPSDVRGRRGKFGDAFHLAKKHFDEKDIQEGKRALAEVTNIYGWESKKFAGRDAELVEDVTKTVVSRLGLDSQLPVTKHFVEAGDQVKEIRDLADTPATHARMIGIYGMGGIGKTTLAKVIYNELLNEFGHRYFLPDVRETARRDGIVYVQNQLIKAIQRIEYPVCDVDDGISLIKSRLKRKKVLILLDDIDHKDQLKALAGERNWFASGSIIIVTTRNEALLEEPEFWVDHKCGLGEMDRARSLLLFNRHTFRKDHSSVDFESISRQIVFTMGGLPLALEVVGSYLYGKTDQEVWRAMLRKLKKEPHIDVQKVLKISYDVLEHKHQEIFLDIACSFIGKKRKFAMYFWEDSGLNASEEIEELKLRCLIKTGHNGELRMHDQLRDFGRNIVNQEGLPEKRTRLWDYEEAFRVLMEKKGTNMIQAICLDKYYDRHPLRSAGHLQTYTSEQFTGLENLRFLQLRGAALSGDFEELFSELRWLQWSDIDPNLSFSATNLHLRKLLVLELSYNQITEHWSGWSSIKAAKWLKVLDLSFCNYLRCTPDLSAFTKLEILILKHCDGLEKVDPSIGKVESLVSLDLSDCGSLKELPQEVGKLEHLKELILDSTGITEIPTSIGSLRKLEKLSANGCQSLREIPDTIGDLQNLQHLDISESVIEKLPSSIGRLTKLRRLSLESCRSLQGEIPSEIGNLSSLEILKITRAPISNLPESIRNLSSLQHLSLKGCDELQSLPELPSGLTYLTVSCQSPRVPHLSCLIRLEELGLYGCDLLEDIPELPPRPLKLCVTSCHKLIKPKLVGFKYLEELSIMYCNSTEILHLSHLNSLKRLQVEYCYDLVEIQGHDNLEFLEEIVIDCCKSIQRLILPELQSLKRLKANYCHNLVEIQGLDRAMSLEALDISDCGSIEGLPDLSFFRALKEFNINDCRNIRGVERLENFSYCRSIYIAGCTSLEKLPNLSNFENLESFTMRYSLGVTEILGVEGSRSLTHIDITGCESIETLPDLSGCEKLQSLVVRDCKKLTRLLGLEKLGSIYLDISGCDSLEPIPKLPGATVFRHYEGRAYGLFHEKISLHEKIILRQR